MKNCIICIIATCFLACNNQQHIVEPVNDLDHQAIIDASIKLIRSWNQFPNIENQSQFWPQPIAALKPVRIYNDSYNLAIVLHEDDGGESGLYVSNPISSYAVMVGYDRFTRLAPIDLSDSVTYGSIYRYEKSPLPMQIKN
jgi:hypothetical protein